MSGIDETAWNAVHSLARRFAERVDASRVDTKVDDRALRTIHLWIDPRPDFAAAEKLLALYAARDLKTYDVNDSHWVTGVIRWEDRDIKVLIFCAGDSA